MEIRKFILNHLLSIGWIILAFGWISWSIGLFIEKSEYIILSLILFLISICCFIKGE